MNEIWQNILKNDIEFKKSKDLYRSLTILTKSRGRVVEFDGREYINFASNNYLDLANDDRIVDAGIKVAKEFGSGSGASRLICGTIKPVVELEERFALFSKKESSLLFNSGYNANLGVISALSDKNSVVFCDKLNHASIYDGIFLSGALLERYPHKDVATLKKLLLKHKDKPKKIVVTDTIFSMEGSITPLKEIVTLSKENNALLIVDEAHSVGLFGDNKSGITTELNLNQDIDIIIGTLGKAFGVFGSYVASDALIKEYLINSSRPFIFTTALSPFIIGALNEALNIVSTEDRGGETLKKALYLRESLKSKGINTGVSQSQIIPIIVGDNKNAIGLMNHLKDNGLYVPAVRPPTVPPNQSRVRVSLSFSHSYEDIDRLIGVVGGYFNAGRF